MSLNVRKIKKESCDLQQIESIYNDAFPESEHPTIMTLLKKAKKQYIHFWSFYDEEVLVGFAYFIVVKGTTFICYLAVDKNIRSKGYGQQILEIVEQQFPDNRIILNIEEVDQEADDYVERQQCKNFYLRNGYRNASFKLQECNHPYEVLVHGTDINIKEYKKLTNILFGWFIQIWRRAKCLPYDSK